MKLIKDKPACTLCGLALKKCECASLTVEGTDGLLGI